MYRHSVSLEYPQLWCDQAGLGNEVSSPHVFSPSEEKKHTLFVHMFWV